jgi:hypothetical protein
MVVREKNKFPTFSLDSHCFDDDSLGVTSVDQLGSVFGWGSGGEVNILTVLPQPFF